MVQVELCKGFLKTCVNGIPIKFYVLKGINEILGQEFLQTSGTLIDLKKHLIEFQFNHSILFRSKALN